jgi:hypothetical protein
VGDDVDDAHTPNFSSHLISKKLFAEEQEREEQGTHA